MNGHDGEGINHPWNFAAMKNEAYIRAYSLSIGI
jgi:hypothetical protein